LFPSGWTFLSQKHDLTICPARCQLSYTLRFLQRALTPSLSTALFSANNNSLLKKAGQLQRERKAVGCLFASFQLPLFLLGQGPAMLSNSPKTPQAPQAPRCPLAVQHQGTGVLEGVREAQALAAVGPGSREVPLRSRFLAPDPARKVGQGALGEGRTERARVAEKGGGEEKREEGKEQGGRGARSVCHSLSPSVYRGCAEWCALRRRRRRSRILRRLAARATRPAFASSSEARHPPRAPDPTSRPGHGRALRPRAPRLLSGAGERCGGQEAGGRPAGERSRAPPEQRKEPVPGAPRPVLATLARATRSPDEPRWLGLNPECTPCNSSPCACPIASRKAPNSSSGMM
jgi:hypothetical protein